MFYYDNKYVFIYIFFNKWHAKNAKEREVVVKFDASRRAVWTLKPMRDNNEGMFRGVGEGGGDITRGLWLRLVQKISGSKIFHESWAIKV